MILGGDHQAAHGRSAGRIAALILVEQGEEARFELLDIGLADARDYGSERSAGVAQQLSEIALRDGGERSEEFGELAFTEGSGRAWPCPTWLRPSLRKPQFELNALAALRGRHEVIMTFRCGARFSVPLSASAGSPAMPCSWGCATSERRIQTAAR